MMLPIVIQFLISTLFINLSNSISGAIELKIDRNYNISFFKNLKLVSIDTTQNILFKYETSSCEENIYLNDLEVNSLHLYQASNLIHVSGGYFINNDSNITMKAGKMIVLKPDTKILRGNKYLGRIEPCTIEIECNEDFITFDKFFTPNGDGFNDYWNIQGLENSPNSKIFIFDRYGKLLKEISPLDKGWDGQFNSSNLSSDDYWFKVIFNDCRDNPRELKSHFSLIR